MHKNRYVNLLVSIFFCSPFLAQAGESRDNWLSLFNGKDLEGWTVKIAGESLDVNLHSTFEASEGILKVNYDGYQRFDMRFGHIFFDAEFSHYLLQLEYKFVGSGLVDAPHWTNLNSGVMLHAQSPQSMRRDQGFPVSIEAQFLAQGTTAGTQTANIVTPGTHVEVDRKLTTAHIVDSSSKLYPVDEWVLFEAEVRGSNEIIYRVNGAEVMRFQNPQLDLADPDAIALKQQGADDLLSRGYIALQAEGQPIWFRNIRLKDLSGSDR
jgi:hypothetical protein